MPEEKHLICLNCTYFPPALHTLLFGLPNDLMRTVKLGGTSISFLAVVFSGHTDVNERAKILFPIIKH